MRILVVKMSSMGDILHTLPAVTDAFNHDPQIKFDWLVEEGFQEIPRWHPAIENVIPVALRRWRQAWFSAENRQEIRAFNHRLKQTPYDWIIDAQGLLKSGLICWLARGQRAGFRWRSAREPLTTLLYHKSIPASWSWHAITRVRVLFAQVLGYAFDRKTVDYGLELPTELHDSQAIWCLHATSQDHKCWAEPLWHQAIEQLNQDGYTAYLPWGNNLEQERAHRLAKSHHAKVLPKLSLTEIAQGLSQASGAITVDTGLGHLSAALKCPTLSLYHTTDPAVIGTLGAYTQHQMMQNTTPTQVVHALKRLIQQKKSSQVNFNA